MTASLLVITFMYEVVPNKQDNFHPSPLKTSFLNNNRPPNIIFYLNDPGLKYLASCLRGI